MANLDVIRTLTLRAKAEGFAAAAGAVKDLGTAVDSSARLQLSMDKNVAAVERRFNSYAKQAQEFEKVQRQLNMAVAQFPELQDRVNAALQAAATRLNQIQSVSGTVTASFGKITSQLASMHSNVLTTMTGLNGLGTGFGTLQNGSGAVTARLGAFNAQLTVTQNGLKTTTVNLGQLGNQFGALPAQIGGGGGGGLPGATNNMNNLGSSTKAARYEMLNFSRQIQDVGVGLASGQAPMTVLIQQGTQIADIFASASLAGRSFGKELLALVTPMSVIVTSTLAVGGAAVAAAFQWTSAQKAIEISLLGIGRASGVTVADINRISESAKNLSISEASGFVSTLAATGKIGSDMLKQLLDSGKDVSRLFGEDIADSAKRLAEAFADPAHGVDDLNKRLGSFSAATIENIKNLKAQGDVVGAQRALFAGLQSGLQGVDATVSNSARGWNVFTNAISNAWTKLGEFTARAAGFGGVNLDTEIAKVSQQIVAVSERLELIRNPRARGVAEAELESLRVKLMELQKALEAVSAQSKEAKQNIASIAQQAAVKVQLPELEQRQAIENNLKALQAFKAEVDATGGEQSEKLAAAKTSWAELGLAIARAENQLKTFKSSFEQAVQTAELGIKAAAAVSPKEKAAIEMSQARIQAERDNRSEVEATRLAELAYTQSITASNTALSEAAKMRKLNAEQSRESAQLEISTMGKTLVQQKEELLNLQTKHQLQQAALAAGLGAEGFDKVELKRLEAINKQTAALQAQLEIMHKLADATGDFINTFVNGMTEGLTATVALGNAVKSLGASITQAASKQIGASIVGGLGTSIGASAAGGGISSLLGGAGGAAAGTAASAGVAGSIPSIAGALGSFAGPIAGIAIGAGISLLGSFLGKSEQKKQEEAQKAAAAQQAAQAAADRAAQFRLQASLSSIDTGTKAGSLAAFELKAQAAREAEARAGGQAMVDLEASLAADRLAIEKDFAEKLKARIKSYDDRIFAATNDMSTLQGQLAAFDRSAQDQREAETKAGGEAMAKLEEVLGIERLKIIKDYNQQILDEQKRAGEEIVAYLQGLMTGQLSPLSAKAQLEAARSAYESQLLLAQGGDVVALANITKVADTLLKASQAFFGSTAGYSRDFQNIQGQLGALAQLSGLAGGGWVTGGTAGRDSVALGMPGEFVVQQSVAQANASWLPSFNATGAMPANDNIVSSIDRMGSMLSSLLQQIAALTEQGNAKIDTNTAVTVGQTQALTREQRFAARKKSA